MEGRGPCDLVYEERLRQAVFFEARSEDEVFLSQSIEPLVSSPNPSHLIGTPKLEKGGLMKVEPL